MKVEIPFLPEFENVMLTGKKSSTSRNKRYGYAGDWFEAFGRTFILLDCYRAKLGVVAFYHYLDEGLNSIREFINVWERLHPRKGYKPDTKVYYHKFKLQSDMAIFHVHELTENDGTRCRICGFELANKMPEE